MNQHGALFSIGRVYSLISRRPAFIQVFLFIPLALVFAGCVSKSTYDRDVARLTRQLQAERGETGSTMTSLEARLADKSATLTRLTESYIQLQAESKRGSERLNRFRADLEELQRDISEVKLVVGKNVEKFPSTTANEILIKLIDMEYRVQVLIKKEAEEAPPIEEITGRGADDKKAP